MRPTIDDRCGIFVKDYPKTDRPKGQTIEHQYHYFDKDGTATVIRSYDDQGKKNIKAPFGVKQSDLKPYRWHEVESSSEIFIVEGELDSDGLMMRGIKAICCRVWTKRHADLLKGKKAILIPDCDKDGMKKANKIANLLTESGVTVKWCQLPRIGNWEYLRDSGGLGSYDYFQLGGSIAELRSCISDFPLPFAQPQQTITSDTDESPVTEKTEKSPSVFHLLMAIVSECYLFKQDSELGETYADIKVGSVRKTYRLRSKEFKAWLTRELYKRHDKSANSEALETCLKICEGEATSNIEPVWMRTAEHDGKIYLDLSNELWQAVEVSKKGWRVVDSHDLPIRFMRSPAQLPIPTPESNLACKKDQPESNLACKIDKLWDILSIAEESKPLVLGWLLSCLVPYGDKPILVLFAPKGSGKSTIATFLVNLADSTKSALLPAVGDRRALAVQSRHRWIFAYDNLSHLSVEQQDAMCCASTGAGYMERALFTDSDITYVEYRRPQVLTSVDLVPTRSDLLDRCLLVKIKPMPESDHKPKKELDELFHQHRAEILGGLLDLLVIALRNRDTINQHWQRMADFHKLAIEAGIPNFNQAYLANIANAQQEAISANSIASAIAELGDFNGTAEELVTRLKAISDDSKVQKLTSATLGRLLKGTLKSDLQAIGIATDSFRQSKGIRWIIQTDKQAKLPTLPTCLHKPIQGKGSGNVGNKTLPTFPTSLPTQPDPKTTHDVGNSVGSVGKGKLPTLPEPIQDKENVGNVGNVGKNEYLSTHSDYDQRSIWGSRQYRLPNHYYLEDGDQSEF